MFVATVGSVVTLKVLVVSDESQHVVIICALLAESQHMFIICASLAESQQMVIARSAESE